MNIEVYSKPGCGKCKAAKSKLQMMGLPYQEHDIQAYITPHEGWRTDGSTEVMAAHTLLDTLPIFRLDGEFCTYPQAMKALKAAAVHA